MFRVGYAEYLITNKHVLNSFCIFLFLIYMQILKKRKYCVALLMKPKIKALIINKFKLFLIPK